MPPNSSNLTFLSYRRKEKHGAIKTNKGKLEGKKPEICQPTTVVNPTLFPAVARMVIFLLVDPVITSRSVQSVNMMDYKICMEAMNVLSI